MTAGIGIRRLTATVATAGLLGLAACSSSGGGGSVSQTQLESKLRKDPQMTQLTTQLKGDKKKVDIVVTCIAKALKKDADQKDLADYVHGKKNLADIGGKAKGSAQKAHDDAQTCAQQAVSG